MPIAGWTHGHVNAISAHSGCTLMENCVELLKMKAKSEVVEENYC